jgi:hypothetical protein
MFKMYPVKSETVPDLHVEDVQNGYNAKPTFDVEKVEAVEHHEGLELEVVEGLQEWTFKAVVAMFGLSLVLVSTFEKSIAPDCFTNSREQHVKRRFFALQALLPTCESRSLRHV